MSDEMSTDSHGIVKVCERVHVCVGITKLIEIKAISFRWFFPRLLWLLLFFSQNNSKTSERNIFGQFQKQ